MNKYIVTTLLLLLLLVTAYFAFYFYSMRNVKEPKYSVSEKSGSIEIRVYQPMIIAEVSLSGNADETITRGFRLLADYIFGNNITMTSPITQQKSTKIAMTAPVMQQQSDKQQWKIRFVMPEEYTIESLPKPNNNQVKIRQVPPKKMVVIQFSGTRSNELIDKNLLVLDEFIKANQLQVIGEPLFAFYNPPWTLPIMKRNEIMYELVE
ncbi:heme-binding protein [Legionella antarctica]|uniref:Heme-binding protein n=1 Tax=Legionella antarctica TaxID=2708020 RepID=A0A6F8T3D5_9GAMM|nr:heme-binding protein [Legionella antarctica]BCA94670.1 heme-binding protein [Legionella antarctica]